MWPSKCSQGRDYMHFVFSVFFISSFLHHTFSLLFDDAFCRFIVYHFVCIVSWWVGEWYDECEEEDNVAAQPHAAQTTDVVVRRIFLVCISIRLHTLTSAVEILSVSFSLVQFSRRRRLCVCNTIIDYWLIQRIFICRSFHCETVITKSHLNEWRVQQLHQSHCINKCTSIYKNEAR